MQIHAIVIAALISLAAAIPGITNVYAPPSEDKKLEKRGPRTIAITTAALPTLFGPAVTRWYNNVFGVQAAPVSQTAGKRDLVDAHLAPALSWDDARAAFIQKTVDDVFKLYVDPSKEAAVCAGTSYTVGRPAATVAFNSYRFNHDGKTQDYDCFVLAGQVNFTVPATATKSEVAVRLGPNDRFNNGVLSVN